MARNALVLGTSESVKNFIAITQLASPSETTIVSGTQSKSVVSESSYLTPGQHSESLELFVE